MQVVMEKFKRWCELPYIQGVIDGIHIEYYYKTWNYNIIAQATIDCNLRSLQTCMLVYLGWLMNFMCWGNSFCNIEAC